MGGQITSGEILADLVAEAVRERQGALGVLVRDIPAPDPLQLLGALAALRAEGIELRIAYLRDGGAAAALALGFEESTFTSDVEQAERWRNERTLRALIVVIAHGDEPKLSSLEDLSTITSRELKRLLVQRALGEEAGLNEVQSRWWHRLRRDNSFGLAPVIDYYAALVGKSGEVFLDAASREIHRLGLLPDPELFNDPSDAAVTRRLERNRQLSTRLQMLTKQDRQHIAHVLKEETVPEERHALQEALVHLDRTRIYGGHAQGLTFRLAERLSQARSKAKPKNSTRQAAERMAKVAAEALVDPDRREDVAAMAEQLRERLNAPGDGRLRPERISVQLPDSTSDAYTEVRTDILNISSKLLGPAVHGGLVRIDASKLETALLRFDADQHILSRWDGNRISEFLDQLSPHPAGAALAESFRNYTALRAKVLPWCNALAVEPLVIATHTPTRELLLQFIATYETLNRTLQDQIEALLSDFGQDANDLLGHFLLLETIVFQVGTRTYALAAPTHPLFLWHYARYAQIVDEQRDRLDARDQQMVSEGAERLPFFLSSLFIPSTAMGTGASLTYLGRLGQLPHFGREVERGVSNDGQAGVRSLVEAQLALEPHAQRGFRLGLIDPPNAGAYLSMLVDLANDGKLSGAHLTVYRHPRPNVSVELRLDEAEEDRVAQVFRAVASQRRFTFEVRDLPQQELDVPPDDLQHLIVAFDQSEGQSHPARPALHPIQPLALPRRIAYRQFRRTVELEPATGGPFEDYHKLVSRLAPGGTSYWAVHQNEQFRETLHAMATRIPWTALVDRHVDRDLAIGRLRIMTDRDGERDVAGFCRSTIPFRRPLRDVVRDYNAFISNDDLDDLLGQLSDLLDGGILNLRPDRSGKGNSNRIKGVLGTLIAARWFRAGADGATRLLISLDSPEARRWLHLSDDPLRADLVGFAWTNGHCMVSVIEVKTVQARGLEYKLDNGVISGPAIDQMLSTRSLLEAVFSAERSDELITTPARREILREHLYRELTKGAYSAEERKLWADRFQRLLGGGVTTDLRCHLVDVRLGVDTSSLREMRSMAQHGADTLPVTVTELNERQIELLIPPEVPEEEREAGATAGTATGGEGAVRDELAGTGVTPPTRPEAEPGPAAPLPPIQPAPPVAEGPDRPRALLGTAPGEYGRPREVWYDPDLPENRLPNPHVMITGETGSGKTQATKGILAELRPLGVPALVLDFKDDYSDESYATAEGLTVYDPNDQSLPFNPLAPALDPRSGRVNPTYHLHQLTDIIKRIYRLGDQQSYRLREAMKALYQQREISLRPFAPHAGTSYPAFDGLQMELLRDKENQPVLGRMSPIFDLELFRSDAQVTEFATIAEQSTVLRLAHLPNDEVKNAVAEFFLMALYNHLIRQAQTHRLGRLLVLDEAWRLVESPFLEPLMREGRAFGLGVLIASQFPADMPMAVAGSTATKLYFSQTSVEQIRDVQRTILGKTSGVDADHLAALMRGLPPLTCIAYSKQLARYARVSINPYFERER